MDFNELPPPPPLLNGDNESEIRYSAAQQNSVIPQGWTPTPAKPLPVVKCTGTTSSGAPCTRWSVRGATVCIKHGAQLPAVKKAAAERVEITRMQMFGATPEAFEVLEGLLQSPTEMVRMKAATEILDRSGLKAGQDVNITVEHVGSPMEDILSQLDVIAGHKDKKEIEDVIDAEEVTDNEFESDI